VHAYPRTLYCTHVHTNEKLHVCLFNHFHSTAHMFTHMRDYMFVYTADTDCTHFHIHSTVLILFTRIANYLCFYTLLHTSTCIDGTRIHVYITTLIFTHMHQLPISCHIPPHSNAHVRAHARTHARTDAYMHARTHTRTHTHTHTHTQLSRHCSKPLPADGQWV